MDSLRRALKSICAVAIVTVGVDQEAAAGVKATAPESVRPARVVATVAKPKDQVYFTRIGPSQSELFIASLDGTHQRRLLPSPSVDYNASFSKEGQWVVFTSERSGSADIYRVRTDGSGLERLTDSPWFDDQAVLSPDGRTVAFVSTRARGTADIWLLDLRTRQSRNLTHGVGGNFRPSWSPDGKTLAFTSDRGQPHRRNDPIWELMHFTALYTMDTDGLGLRRLTPVDEVEESPKWSLDGARIVYTHRSDDQHPRQIVALTLQTGAKEIIADRLPGGPSVSAQYIGDREVAYTTAGTLRYTSGRQASDPIRAIHPTWSPDATMVVYERTIAEPSVTTPIVAAYSIDPRFELFRTGASPTFSPDGRQFLVSGNLLPSGNRSISLMDASGTNPRTIFPDHKLVIGGTSWSSDGSLIAFGLGGFFERPVTPARLATIRPDGSDFRVLTEGDGSSGLPSFAPDGARIVFRALGKNDQGLRILSLADKTTSTLTTAWDNFPSWSPCGDRITFTRQVNGDFEIFTIKADGTELRQLTHDHGNNAHSIWSPEGQWIMFASSRMGSKDDEPGFQPYGELFVMRADGTELQQITDNRWEDVTGAWLTSNGLPRDELGCKRAR